MRDPVESKRRSRERRQFGLEPLKRGEEPDERTMLEHEAEVRRQRIAKGLIRVARERPDWYDQAACKGKTALMFLPARPNRGVPDVDVLRNERQQEVAAKALCATCPARTPCSEQARRDREYGIWGGETEYDRARLGIAPNAARGRLAQVRREAGG